MALDWQALAAKKAWKAFETCEALEQVAARIKRVMGLTTEFSRREAVGCDDGLALIKHIPNKRAGSQSDTNKYD